MHYNFENVYKIFKHRAVWLINADILIYHPLHVSVIGNHLLKNFCQHIQKPLLQCHRHTIRFYILWLIQRCAFNLLKHLKIFTINLYTNWCPIFILILNRYGSCPLHLFSLMEVGYYQFSQHGVPCLVIKTLWYCSPVIQATMCFGVHY
jgi:predicted transglutaminase-like protease